ncbi:MULTISPECIES: helix-turn-helix domain-containing protein [Streptomyces]|uniref:Helix-turn-helix transcriptional regulator n=1 Tax=Streptomyces evansiae TaxID=3075535 RepID=A0ABD5E5L4_9ACTN|nr:MULTISPECIES: helix-turn-helix transcriptional regulator [unclassified Streptomyces]ASY32914.1 transcriptional regulator [Streptomyces sp. CLI2509]MDT0416589.1 helix-turn-helix transcriptional regulator [Streptomyces sp. DSM 41982]MYX21076.1 helix-turn-helix domain-containing protein [Streptomyces sp. SID8380]
MVNRKALEPARSPGEAFGEHLRRLRDGQGWTQEELAARMGISASHVSAVETGRRPPTPQFAKRADRELGTGDELQRRSRVARRTSLLEGFPEYVDHELRASEIRVYEVGVIPGILQTRAYAETLTARSVERGAITAEQGEERLALIAARQEALRRSPLPLVFVLLDESCLCRPVGASAVMAAQLGALVEFAALPNTVVQVIPFAMGDRRPLSLPLYILTMDTGRLIAYAESAHQGTLEHERASVMPLLTSYHQMQAEAPSQPASVAMIERLRKGTT